MDPSPDASLLQDNIYITKHNALKILSTLEIQTLKQLTTAIGNRLISNTDFALLYKKPTKPVKEIYVF